MSCNLDELNFSGSPITSQKLDDETKILSPEFSPNKISPFLSDLTHAKSELAENLFPNPESGSYPKLLGSQGSPKTGNANQKNGNWEKTEGQKEDPNCPKQETKTDLVFEKSGNPQLSMPQETLPSILQESRPSMPTEPQFSMSQGPLAEPQSSTEGPPLNFAGTDSFISTSNSAIPSETRDSQTLAENGASIPTESVENLPKNEPKKKRGRKPKEEKGPKEKEPKKPRKGKSKELQIPLPVENPISVPEQVPNPDNNIASNIEQDLLEGLDDLEFPEEGVEAEFASTIAAPAPSESLPAPAPAPNETLPAPSESLPAPSESLPAPSESLPAPAPAPSESLPAPAPAPNETLPAPSESLPAPSESLPAPSESLPAPSESLPAPAPAPAPSETLPTPAPAPAPSETLPTNLDSKLSVEEDPPSNPVVGQIPRKFWTS